MKAPMGVMNGIQYVAGVGFVQDHGGGGQVGALGDDAAVMMISGLGADAGVSQSYSGSTSQPLPGLADLKAQLGRKYKFFGIELPMWLWLLVAAGVLGAGFIFFNKKHHLIKL